jgi:formylglycine-generating enzyme required for sulfatase activity
MMATGTGLQPIGTTTTTPDLIKSLGVVLPEFSEIIEIYRAGSCTQLRATHSSGQPYSVFVSTEKLDGFNDADYSGFLPDAKIAMGIEHRNLIRPLHLTRIPGHFVLITEHIDGPTLGHLIRKKQIDRDTAVTTLYPLVEALGVLHESGVMHRALNPECIFAEKDGTLRILGAGFANLLLPLWTAVNQSHKRRLQSFLSPETGNLGLSGIDTSSDIFSLGILHYYALTEALPKGSFFSLPSQKARVEAYVDCGISRAIQTKPHQRHANIAEFIEEMAGNRPRDAHQLSFNNEEPSLNFQKSRDLDGAFSWITKTRLFIGLGFLAAMLGGGSFIIWEQNNLANSGVRQDIDAILAKLAEAKKDFSLGLNAEAIAKLYEVAREAQLSRQVLSTINSMLIDAGEYEQALKIFAEFAGRATEDMPEHTEFMAFYKQETAKISDFLDLRTLATTANLQNADQAEHKLLLRAAALMPGDKNIQALLAANPFQIEAILSAAIAQLKQKNPQQKTWRYHAEIHRSRTTLNLSGNAYLANIDALSRLPIHCLDLSDTGVNALTSLTKLPLSELYLDNCPLLTLAPLASLPLRTLSIKNVRVPLPSDTWFTNIPHRPGDPNAPLVAPSDAYAWENSCNMRFQPLDGEKYVVMAEREVTVDDYAQFLGDSALPVGTRDVQVFKDDKWQRIETTDWRKPGHDLNNDDPVVGLTYSECQDFCKWLTKKEQKVGLLSANQRYRLPSDYEWSLAAGYRENPMIGAATRIANGIPPEPSRPGSTHILAEGYSDELELNATELAKGNPVHASGQAYPHAGFYDIAGNAREWCRDTADDSEVMRVVRGGGVELGQSSRLHRDAQHRMMRAGDVGFRLALELFPAPDHSLIVHELLQKDATKARLMAEEMSVQGQHPAIRAAGISALEVLDHAQSAERSQRYYLANLPTDWQRANKLAKLAGGHLASITSFEEFQWIEQHYFTNTPGAQTIWLGANNGTGGDRWSWANAEPWRFDPRDLPPAQDDPKKTDYREGALTLSPGTPIADGKAAIWKKSLCTRSLPFLIEWETPKDTKKVVMSIEQES